MSSSSITINDFSPHIFWDVDRGKLDMEQHKKLIVERVIQRGSRKDLNQLLAYYGKEEVAEIIKQAAWLDEKDSTFVHVFFDIPYHEMKCCIKKPFSRHY
jgi:hypothetical protein